MNIDFQTLEADITQLLTKLDTFAPAEVAEVKQFLVAGEYGVAFETLCGIVKEEGKSVPAELRPKIRILAEQMGIDPKWWAEITDSPQPEFEPIDLETVRPAVSLHGEIVCKDDPGHCSILIGGKLLTAGAFQALLNLHEGFHIQLTITDPTNSPSLRR